MARRRRRRRRGGEGREGVAAIVTGAVLLGLIGIFLQSWLAFLILCVISGGIVALWRASAARERKAAEEFRRKQFAMGLVPFRPRIGGEWWGTPEDVRGWSEKERLVAGWDAPHARLLRAIGDFRPSLRHASELPYHMELAGFLKARFPETRVEQARGSTRPDITIGNVAIEVKGPTTARELQTIADKCMRYARHHEQLIVVLFDVKVYPRFYREWEEALRTTFPQVMVVAK